MSDHDQYRYMAQQPQHTNTSRNDNYNNIYTYPDYSQPSESHVGQQQMMYESGQDTETEYGEYRSSHEYEASDYYAGSGEKLRPLFQPRRRATWPWYLVIPLLLLIMMMGGMFGFHERPAPQVYSYHDGPWTDGHDGRMMGDGQGDSDTIQRQIPLNGVTPQIVVNDVNGSVHIHSIGSVNQVTVTITVHNGESANNVPLTFDNRTGMLSVSQPNADSGYDVDIITPANAQVQVQEGYGDVTLDGLQGQVNVQSSDGSITANDISGNATLSVNEGSITVDGLNGQANLTDKSGSINLTHTDLSGQSVISAENGSIQFDGTLNQQGTYDFEASNDSVNLMLPDNASFQLRGTWQGISNDFNVNTPGDAPRPVLNVNDPGGNLTITKGQ